MAFLPRLSRLPRHNFRTPSHLFMSHEHFLLAMCLLGNLNCHVCYKLNKDFLCFVKELACFLSNSTSSIFLKVLVHWREFLIKICLKMKDVKENSVQYTDWDSNRECLKFDEKGKHSSSTKMCTSNNYKYIISGKCTASNSY